MSNLDRFSEPTPWEGRDLEREQEIEAERADRWQDEEIDRELSKPLGEWVNEQN